MVDHVVRFHLRKQITAQRVLMWNQDMAHCDLLQVPHHDRRFSRERTGGDQPLFAHLGDRLVIRLICCRRRHLSRCTIRIVHTNIELGRFSNLQHQIIRDDVDADDLRFVRTIPWDSLVNPSQQGLVILPRSVQNLSSAMRRFARRFFEEQTVHWCRQRDSTPSRLPGESSKIEIGVKPQKRQLKTILSSLLAMARPLIASSRREDWLNIQFEADEFSSPSLCTISPHPESRDRNEQKWQAEDSSKEHD